MDSDLGSNVRFSPENRAAPTQTGLVLKTLAIADFGTKHEGGPLRVDKNSFSQLLETLSPQLDLGVPDGLGSGQRELRCSLRFSRLDDFGPDGIVQQVPLLAGLVRARQLLTACLDKQTDLPTVRQDLIAAFAGTCLAGALSESAPTRPTPAPAAAATGVDSLLAKVDLPAGSSQGPSAESLADILTQAVSPASQGPTTDPERLRDLVSEIDTRLTRQVAAIYAAPKFEALEATWRGLKLLVDRTDFRAGLLLEVLPSNRDDFLDDFFDKVFRQEYDNLSEVGLSLVLNDFAFARGTPDLKYLKDVARVAESLNVPFILAMDPQFWGVRQAKLLASLPDLLEKAGGPEYSKWTSFRNQDDTLWLCLTANRLALRTGWDQATRSIKGFVWKTDPDRLIRKPLWGSSVWAMGAALSQSFAEQGARFPCCGTGSPGSLDELVLTEYQTRRESFAYPLEVRFSDNKTTELSQTGFAPLVAESNSDSAYFRTAPTFHRPSRYTTKEATRASFLAATLPYQAFAGMAANAVQRCGMTAGGGSSNEEIRQRFRDRMLSFLAACEDNPDPAEVEIELNDNQETGGVDVAIRLRPRFTIYGGEVDLMLGTTVPR